MGTTKRSLESEEKTEEENTDKKHHEATIFKLLHSPTAKGAHRSRTLQGISCGAHKPQLR